MSAKGGVDEIDEPVAKRVVFETSKESWLVPVPATADTEAPGALISGLRWLSSAGPRAEVLAIEPAREITLLGSKRATAEPERRILAGG
jgi:hypothetical protein